MTHCVQRCRQLLASVDARWARVGACCTCRDVAPHSTAARHLAQRFTLRTFIFIRRAMAVLARFFSLLRHATAWHQGGGRAER